HFNLPLPQENVVRSRSGRRGLIVTHFLSIGPATTLALARVLALAAIVAGFATALALARVLTLTDVLFLYLLIGLLVVALALILRAVRSLQRREQVWGTNGPRRSGKQSRERRARQDSLCRLRHFQNSPIIRMMCETRSGYSWDFSNKNLAARTKQLRLDGLKIALSVHESASSAE